jgi:hypothetical protein
MIHGGSKIDTAYSSKRPEAAGRPKDADIPDAVTVIIRRDRFIGTSPEIYPGNTPGRPESGDSPKDRAVRSPGSVIITREGDIINPPKINPGNRTNRPKAGGRTEDGYIRCAIPGKICGIGIMIG